MEKAVRKLSENHLPVSLGQATILSVPCLCCPLPSALLLPELGEWDDQPTALVCLGLWVLLEHSEPCTCSPPCAHYLASYSRWEKQLAARLWQQEYSISHVLIGRAAMRCIWGWGVSWVNSCLARLTTPISGPCSFTRLSPPLPWAPDLISPQGSACA